MDDVAAGVIRWVVPAIVVFGVTALAVAVLVWGVRRARRSPAARKRAEAERLEAGAVLVRLDDAIAELELEVGLSGALYGGDAPASLRRARLTAQHTRDAGFDLYRTISLPAATPVEVRRGAARIREQADKAATAIRHARSDHVEWMGRHVTAGSQLAATRRRLDDLRASMGDPAPLLDQLAASFAEDEWRTASDAATNAVTEAAEAQVRLDAAAAAAEDPSRNALADIAAAERALRQAEADARAFEESYRLITQASQALSGEFEATRTAMRQAVLSRGSLPPDDADRLADEVRAIEADLNALERDAARRPTWTIDRIARLRDRLDLALGDARTAQQRLRGARTALPGTLAAARNAVAMAEAVATHTHGSADARSRLRSAQRELANARASADPVAALDAARRAMREAEDAKALADYDRLHGH